MDPQTIDQQPSVRVRPSLLVAYLWGMLKLGFVSGLLVVGVIFMVQTVGLDTFQSAVNFSGYDLVVSQTMMLYGVVGFSSILFILLIFRVLGLSSRKWDFYNDKLMFSPGKETKRQELGYSSITSINYRRYGPFKIGELLLYMSGTDSGMMKIVYVNDVQDTCERANQLLFDYKALTFQQARPPTQTVQSQPIQQIRPQQQVFKQ